MLPPEYKALLCGDIIPPSWVVAQLPPEQACPGVTEILEFLRAADLPLAEARPAHKPSVPNARWELEIHLETGLVEGADEQELRLWVVPSEALDELHLDWAQLSDAEKALASRSRWSLGSSTDFGEFPLFDFHRQLQVLLTAAPSAPVFFDVTACRAHAAVWVQEAAHSDIPPPPLSLYAIHAVYPEPGKRRGTWLHTHGLVRCGVPELEMLDTAQDAVGSCGLLINTVAAMVLEGGMPEPATAFQPGAHMDLVWLPWQQGLARLKRGRVGGPADRDEYHASTSAILFAPVRRWFLRHLVSPTIYREILEGNPLLYVSTMETNRMAALARDRLDRFASIFDDNAGLDDWVFLVKLGYPVDGAEEEDDREHLWFEVHHLAGSKCEATLLNEPYSIGAMHEGERSHHDLGLLTDWQILSPYGRYSADTVVHLQRKLEDGSAPSA